MQNKIIIGLLSALCLVLILFWLYYSGHNDDKLVRQAAQKMHLESIIHLKNEIRRKDSVILAVQVKRKTDSVEHSKTQRTLIGQINSLKKQRVKIVYVPAVCDSINDQLAIADSTISKQDILIEDKNKEHISAVNDFNKIIDLEKQKVKAKEEIAANWESLYNDSEKNLKKQRRGAKVLKAVGVALAGLLVYQSVK